jgi:UDP-N-acetylmuramyl pentapeptide phosphotransferase/UDP-N-acetylglucosamine-1-phosphate transferase
LAIVLVLKECDLIQINWWVIPLFILLIGIVNAYNFMDGINGLTGFYSLAIFVPFWIFEEDYMLKEFMLISILSLIVFLFFNGRKKARCFAGDIGSISMALMVLFVLLKKILETGNYQFMFFLTVYGVDSILTLSQRLINGENIFEPHRKHLYQLLVNEYKLPHLIISGIYASVQLILNSWIINKKPSSFIVIIVVLVIGFIYLGIKYILIKNYSKKEIHN